MFEASTQVFTLIRENRFSNTYKADIGGMAGFMLGMSVATIVALLDSVRLFVRDLVLNQPRTYQKYCLLLLMVSNTLLCVYAPDHSDTAKATYFTKARIKKQGLLKSILLFMRFYV